MLEVYAVKLQGNISMDRFKKCLSLLQLEKRMKIERILNFKEAQRSLVADLLIRTIVKEKKKLKSEEISFSFNEFGKPFLVGHKDFQFNISHSGDWIVCVLDKNPIGIDIEEVISMDIEIASTFFTEEEYQYILSCSEFKRLEEFYRLWVLKESYIKAIGKGLSIKLDSFSIRCENDSVQVYTENEYKKCFFKEYKLDPAYKLAVCSQSQDFTDSINVKNIDDIIYKFSEIV